MTGQSIPRSDDHDLTPAVDASYSDSRTGALWVHKDLVKVRDDWADPGPPRGAEMFGDVESWAKYVKRFASAGEFAPLLGWSATGLRAVLDYHTDSTRAGRLQWTAAYVFVHSPEWTAWISIAHGRAVPQKQAIEFLEDHADDVTAPPAGDLLNMLRNLRATVNKSAQTELRADGTTYVTWVDDKGVAARGATMDLPPEFTIAVPILKGHVDSAGKPVVYELKVKLRASVDDQARLALRFSIPNAERALEAGYADRVAAAARLLGEEHEILRAAG